MSGRPCRPAGPSQPTPHEGDGKEGSDGADAMAMSMAMAIDRKKAARKLVLSRLHDAAQLGDVESVRRIFDDDENRRHNVNVNMTRRGKNTTLHTALLHNVEGPLIDYLVREGADVNAENARGYAPLTMAIVHCKGSRAAEKLVAAGAEWQRFESGAFQGMSAMDVAAKYDNKHAIDFFERLVAEKNGNICRDVSATPMLPRGRAICPVCSAIVKFPTGMSRILRDQEQIEGRITKNGELGSRRRKYISRKYMDQLLVHSGGRTYERLCGIEYHGVENMRLRKEISESYGVLHAVHECCTRLGIGGAEADPARDNNVHLENIFLIDLCSGKGITTALCGALDDGENNNYFLAVDKLLPHQIPHFLNDDRVRYLCRDIMSDATFAELADIVRHQTVDEGRTCILVGMHLCGLLSDRAIEFFERIGEISALVLSPCCLPKKHEQRAIAGFTKGTPPEGGWKEGDADLCSYLRWADYLRGRVDGLEGLGASDVKIYRDDEMHSEKNAIILGVRR